MTLCIGGPCAGQRVALGAGQERIMVQEYVSMSEISRELHDPNASAVTHAHWYVRDMLFVNNRQVPVLRWTRLKSEDLIIELLDQYLPNVAMSASRNCSAWNSSSLLPKALRSRM